MNVNLCASLFIISLTASSLTAQMFVVEGDGFIDGKLGVGTDSPPALLSIRSAANDTEKLLNFGENNNLSFFFEAGFLGTGVTGNTLKLNTFGNSNSTNAMTWRGDGNVGIGATNPDERLEVDGNVKINGRIDILDGATNIFIGRGVATTASPQECVLIGHEAGSLLTAVGVLSTFVGKDAGRMATSGRQNAAFGGNAAEALTTEEFGTYIGSFAGSESAADFAVFIGYDANASGSFRNAIALGSHSLVSGENRIVLGNAAQTEVQAYANISTVSDRRFKKNVQENVAGLEFIMDLRPVTYQLDARKLDDFMRAGMKRRTGVNMRSYHRALADKGQISCTGFVAQEVEAVASNMGFTFSGLVKPQHSNDHYGLRYAEFVVPLVKGMQEQQQQIDLLVESIDALGAKLEAKEEQAKLHEERLADVESLLKELLDARSVSYPDVEPLTRSEKLKQD